MATHKTTDWAITVKSNQDKRHVILIVRDKLGNEVEVQISKASANVVAWSIMDVADEL